jgi:hypothetical protein
MELPESFWFVEVEAKYLFLSEYKDGWDLRLTKSLISGCLFKKLAHHPELA